VNKIKSKTEIIFRTKIALQLIPLVLIQLC